MLSRGSGVNVEQSRQTLPEIGSHRLLGRNVKQLPAYIAHCLPIGAAIIRCLLFPLVSDPPLISEGPRLCTC